VRVPTGLNKPDICEIPGFCHCAFEVCAVLGCFEAQFCGLLTFRDGRLVLSSKVKLLDH
jgi:hypothetical protein